MGIFHRSKAYGKEQVYLGDSSVKFLITDYRGGKPNSAKSKTYNSFGLHNYYFNYIFIEE